MEQQIDFLAIGDIAIDAFIRLSPESARVTRGENGTEKICMSFGDKIPYESVDVVYAVGNSSNAAVAAARLGLSPALVSDLGADDNGTLCLEALEAEKVLTDFITRHESMKTNYHYVLRYKEERTILVKHEAYPYALPDFPPPRWLYLSSLGESSLDYHHRVAEWLTRHPDTMLAFQPGTFQMKLGYEKLADIYKRTTLFVCNMEEAGRILAEKGSGAFSSESEEKAPDPFSTKKLLTDIHALGPKIVAITDGPRGAYASDGSEIWFMPIYPDPAPPVSRTGAGDAFASTFTTALALGKTLPEALAWAPINSMSVVQQIGAQTGLLARDKLEEYLVKAPGDYRPRKI